MHDPRVGLMLSEDNVLAAAQAVATSSRSDLDHYIIPEGRYEMDWLQKDIKANLVRTLVAADDQNQGYMDLQQVAFERRMQTVEAAEKKLAEAEVREKEALARAKGLEAEVERWTNPQGEDLEKISVTHFDHWVNEYMETKEGNDWRWRAPKVPVLGAIGMPLILQRSTTRRLDKVRDDMLGHTTVLDAAYTSEDVARVSRRAAKSGRLRTRYRESDASGYYQKNRGNPQGASKEVDGKVDILVTTRSGTISETS
ncbi:hypothetical protein Droror1_Dr00020483 [Drosera rotundifolia]